MLRALRRLACKLQGAAAAEKILALPPCTSDTPPIYLYGQVAPPTLIRLPLQDGDSRHEPAAIHVAGGVTRGGSEEEKGPRHEPATCGSIRGLGQMQCMLVRIKHSTRGLLIRRLTPGRSVRWLSQLQPTSHHLPPRLRSQTMLWAKGAWLLNHNFLFQPPRPPTCSPPQDSQTGCVTVSQQLLFLVAPKLPNLPLRRPALSSSPKVPRWLT